jgi:DNA-binding LacI/PurR family transcriptional regulator
VPISDVAKKSGVSMATVSLVLNNAPRAKYIAESTKEAVRQAAKELN